MKLTLDINTLASEFGFEGKIIGFANKFFTLWEYKITKNEDTNKLAFDAFFIKNIGLTNPYEGAYPFDKGLKGTELHITSSLTGTGLCLSKLEIRALKFSKNPFKGAIIAEFNNADTLCWKLNNSVVDDKKPEDQIKSELANMTNRAIELGCEKVEDKWFTAKTASCTQFSSNPARGAEIATFSDDGLLCWKYRKQAVGYGLFGIQSLITKELENIKTRALELGAIEFNDKIYSVKDQESDWFKKMVASYGSVENGDSIETTADSNLSLDGSLFVNGFVFQFDHKYYPATYYGPEYCLPLDKKGKAKRIKHQNIRINKYEKVEEAAHTEYDFYGVEITVPARTYYKVLDWEFVK